MGLRPLSFLFAGLLAAGARAQEARIEWYETEARLAQRLENEDVRAIARELAADKSNSLETRLMRLGAFVRADHGEQALEAVEALAAAEREVLRPMCRWLIGRERDGLARRLFELRPELQVGWTWLFLERMVAADGLGETVAWVQAREEQVADPWLNERAQLLARHGEVGPLLDELEEAVRAQPDDVNAVLRFLELTGRYDRARKVGWVADVAQTSGPLQDIELGRALMHLAPSAALKVVRRSVTRDLDSKDRALVQKRMRLWMRNTVEDQDIDALFRFEARHVLLDALMAAGEAQEAQALMEALTEEKAEAADGARPRPGWLERSGQVQRASGQRVIEKKVLDEEELSADDPQYWLGRSAYFTGRRELSEALAAAQRAVDLTPLAGDPGDRSRAVDAVAALIRRIDGREVAYEYLHEELARVEEHGGFALESSDGSGKGATEIRKNRPAHAQHIVYMLATDYPRLVGAEDELLWRYLKSVPALDVTTRRLAGSMAVNGDAGDEFWERLTRIVRAGEPSGREHLGFMMIARGHPGRAFTFLRESLGVVPDGEHRERCGRLMVSAGLESGDWRTAEQAWLLGQQYVGPDGRVHSLGRMALLAAKDGEIDTALRLWQMRANYDLGDMHAVVELAGFPSMAERLREWYAELAKGDPACGARIRFLEALKGH